VSSSIWAHLKKILKGGEKMVRIYLNGKFFWAYRGLLYTRLLTEEEREAMK